MDSPITVSYRWSADEMVLVNRLHMRYSAQGRKLNRSCRSGGILFVCIGILCLCAVGVTTQKTRAIEYGLALVSMGAVLLVGVPRVLRRATLKAYAKRADRDLLVTYELSEEGLTCKNDVASTDLQWRGVLKAVRTVDGFLLYVSDIQIHWLPARSFRDPADANRFAELLKGKVKDYEEVG